jgi:hypothetical protein
MNFGRGWVFAIPPDGIVSDAMLDCGEDFQACLLNLLHGFYKQAIAALQSALETMTLVSACEMHGDQVTWTAWRAGEELRFTQVCDRLRSSHKFHTLEESARNAVGQTIYLGEDNMGRNAWGRSLYRRLCKFVHARGDTSNGSL